jgi:hypothetical protein
MGQARAEAHRLQGYIAFTDPDFETKAADIIGLYLNPPQHAAVFCVDEKAAIQALARKDRGVRNSVCEAGMRLVHGGGRRLRRTTDAVGKSVPHVTRRSW